MQPHRRQPTRLPHPWDSLGKNTGVGCHFLLQCMRVKNESEVAQSCPTLNDPMDCSLPGSSIHGISQARVLECKLLQSCPTLGNPMDCSLPGSSIHGIFQARVLEWGAIAFSESYLSVQFSRSVMSDSLQPHESQHARPPYPSPTPGVHSNSRPSSQ